MLRPNLGGTEVETLFVILHYLPHFTLGSIEVYLSKAYADRKTCKMIDFAHRV